MLMRIAPVLLAAVGCFAAGLVFLHSPAFSPSLRVTGPTGDWRLSPGSALYNAGRYQRLMARAFLDAAPFEADGSLIEDPYRAATRTRAMAIEAEALLLQSLRLSPSDARAWADLAWARLLREDVAGAETALERSWALAPRDLDLAIRRLDAIDVLYTAYPTTVASDFGLEGATEDMQTLARHRPRTFADYLSFSPFLADLAGSRGLAPPNPKPKR